MPLLPKVIEKTIISLSVATLFTSLASCMSIPTLTMARLAPLSPLEANPADIKVAILAPEDLVLKKGDVEMTASWMPVSSEKREYSFDLDVLVGNAAAPQLISKMIQGQKLNVLRLDDASILSLRDFQAEVLQAKARHAEGEGRFAVGFKGACWNGTFPADKRPMPFKSYIQTEPGAEFLPLFEGVDVRDLLKQANMETLPSCPVVIKKNARTG